MSKVTWGSLLSGAASFLFPRKCVACGALLEHESPQSDSYLEEFCNFCKKRVHRTRGPYCPYCGIEKSLCRCRGIPRAYDMAIAPFYYDGAIKDAMGRLKFGKKEGVSEFFAREISREIEARYFGIQFDILTCVPATRESLANRGFNQSVSIAECLEIKNQKNLTVDYELLGKNRQRNTQHFLGAESRRANVENSYYLNHEFIPKNKTILLIDDILTTGATTNACSRELMLGGAQKVYVAVGALAILHNDF